VDEADEAESTIHYNITSMSVCHAEMGETASIFTLKAQCIPCGNIFGGCQRLLDLFILFDLEKCGRRRTIA